MKKIAFFLTIMAFAACNTNKTSENPPPAPTDTADNRLDFTIEPGKRVGLITAENCTREAVLAAYGDQAKADSIYLFEGMMDEGVVLFPNEPRRTATIWWDKSMDPKRPAFIRIHGDSTGTSEWKTTSGLTVGSSIADVERLNGKPFRISGFGWDYGGMVTDWQGGALDNGVNVGFMTTADQTAERILGEGEGFPSNDPDVVAARPVVSRLDFRFLANDPLPACIEAKVSAFVTEGKTVVVRKMNVAGADHYWVSDGAAAYDGIEYIYDANCAEKCRTGGMRQALECMQAYEKGTWEVVRETK